MTTAQPIPAQPTDQGTATPDQTLQTEQAQPGASAETPQENQQPQYVTKEDLAQFGNQLAKQLKQSARDRDNRIEEQVNSLKELVTKSGVQITPQQEQALRSQIAEQLETEEAEPEQPQPRQNADELVNQFVNESLSVFGEGVKANPNSPYFADLQKALTANFNNPNPAAVNKAIIEYGKKEAARITSQKENADARVLGGGGGIATGTDANAPAADLWKQAYHIKQGA